MADLWVTIPSAGRATLAGAINSTGIPRDRIVIVDTSGTVQADGCHVVRDDGPINIQRWWNTGIDYAQVHGATHVAVLNDDVLLGQGALSTLLAKIGPAAISSVGGGGLFTEAIPEWRALNGACWLLDLATGLRADEGYHWWYGDDDLDWRARTQHGGVMSLQVEWAHLHPNEETKMRADLIALTELDRLRWHQRGGRRKVTPLSP